MADGRAGEMNNYSFAMQTTKTYLKNNIDDNFM